MKTVKVNLKSEVPLIMRNPTTADPFSVFTKEIQVLQAKKKKTDAELLKLKKLQFFAHAYFNDEDGFHLPGNNFFHSLINGAKKHSNGKKIKEAVQIMDHNVKLKIPSAPKNLEKTYEKSEFVDYRLQRGDKNKAIMVCSPIFVEWEASYTLAYDENILTLDNIKLALEMAGKYCCVGAMRPNFGKYTATITNGNGSIN